ncbi:hypothetical protein Rs2_23146 [Raphanus sativus]|nr:hypothetical protein Rs2_23146 [Raphanus sativus]
METGDQSAPPLRIPDRIFALGHEPVGVRVTPYHKPNAIKEILNALDPQEIDIIRASPFGKLVELAEMPSFSGRFGRFIISRQLKVENKHEAWFIFAGKPVRFSLREFAYVTGLNCSKFPKHNKKRSKLFLSQKPYWGELFGSMKEVPVTSVVKMLKKRTVKESGIRVKYALLALLAAVVLPTTHTPRISQDHAERIKNIDDFLAYPWGRVSFEMLISSIKERNEVSLAQNTIALKGFVLSLQLVMVEAIPALTEVVNDGSSSDSEVEGGDDFDQTDDDKNSKRGISPGYARDTDAAGKVAVRSVIVDDDELYRASPEFGWSEDEEDPIGRNLISLVEEGYPFKNSSFLGGVTMAELNRMREDAKAEANTRKTVRVKQTKNTTTTEVLDSESVAFLVREKVKEDLSRMENQINKLSSDFLAFQTDAMDKFQQLIRLVDCSSSQAPRENASTAAGDTERAEVRRPSSQHIGIQTEDVNKDIIAGAVRFANQETSSSDEGLDRDQGIQDHESHEDQPRSDIPEVMMQGLNADEMIHPAVQTECQPSLPIDEDMLTEAPADNIQLAEANKSSTEVRNGDQQIIPPSQVHPSRIDSESIVPDAKIASNPTTSLVEDIMVDEEAEASEQDLDPALLFPKPTFSLGLTQEERPQGEEPVGGGMPGDLAHKGSCEEDQLVVGRKSKRLKAVPKSLVGEYQCDMRLLNRARVAFVDPNNIGGNIDYSAKFSSLLDKLKSPFTIRIGQTTLDSNELYELVHRSNHLQPKVVDVLMGHIRSQFTLNTPDNMASQPVFLDNQFVSQLSKVFPKFSKSSKKDTFRFPSNILDRFKSFPESGRFYFPFNLDTKHWVGVCVDYSTWSISVFDCNISLRTDSMMVKEISHIAQMFPFLLKQVGKQVVPKDGKAMAVERPRSIPQNTCPADSGAAAVLLMQAHAVAGIDVCKCINADVIGSEVERLAVMFYEATVGML